MREISAWHEISLVCIYLMVLNQSDQNNIKNWMDSIGKEAVWVLAWMLFVNTFYHVFNFCSTNKKVNTTKRLSINCFMHFSAVKGEGAHKYINQCWRSRFVLQGSMIIYKDKESPQHHLQILPFYFDICWDYWII